MISEAESIQARTETPVGILPGVDKLRYGFVGRSTKDECTQVGRVLRERSY